MFCPLILLLHFFSLQGDSFSNINFYWALKTHFKLDDHHLHGKPKATEMVGDALGQLLVTLLKGLVLGFNRHGV